jgi:hypothetical protein
MHKVLKAFLWTLGVAVGLLLLVQLAGSPLATHLANRKLAAMPQFTGSVDHISLQLWRGSITVHELQLVDRDNAGDGPVVKVPQATLSLAWAPVFRGRIGGDADIDKAQVKMIKRAETAKDEEQKAKKLSKPVVRAWQDVLAKQFPIEFRKIEIKRSQLLFEDRSDPGVVHLSIDQINLTLTGFSNRAKSEEELPAMLKMHARIAGSGILNVDARADPSQREPRFEVTLEAKAVPLVEMHDFLVRYALVDVKSGEFELYSEVSAANGGYKGYTKPFFKELKFEAVPDPEKSLLQRAATKVASAMQHALKNEKGEVATKAPFEGNFEDNKLDVWATLENLLRNAFIQALREGLEGQTPTPKGKG